MNKQYVMVESFTEQGKCIETNAFGIFSENKSKENLNKLFDKQFKYWSERDDFMIKVEYKTDYEFKIIMKEKEKDFQCNMEVKICYIGDFDEWINID